MKIFFIPFQPKTYIPLPPAGGRNFRTKHATASFCGGCLHGRPGSETVADAHGRTGVGTIFPDGKAMHLGSFTDEIEAPKTYDRKARELHGEFARLNFPDDYA